MIRSEDCIYKYGTPSDKNKYMVLWTLPDEFHIGMLPKRIYCNEDIVGPLTDAFRALIQSGCIAELRTWDGCFNVRKMRGSNLMSLHSWGVAVDVNAKENPMGGPSRLSKDFVKCFTDNGFNWGGNWTLSDPMHFELKEIPR